MEIDSSNQQLPITQNQTPQQTTGKVVNRKRNFLTILGIIFIILIIGIVSNYYIANKNQLNKQHSQQANTPSPTVIQNLHSSSNYKEKLGSSKIAYIKDKKLYLLNSSGSKITADNVYDGKYKFSPDGKYLAWIDKEIVKTPNPNYPDGGYPNEVGTSLSLLNLETNEIKKVIPRKYTDGEFRKPRSEIIYNSVHSLNFHDFDFVKDNPLTVVYLRDGVRLKNIVSGSEETLLENSKIVPPDLGMSGYTYIGVLSNQKNESLLLTKGLFECDPGGVSIYNLRLKKIEIEENDLLGDCDSTHSIWLPDGKYVVNYDKGGNVPEGLWITNLASKTKQKLVDKRAIDSVTVSKENVIVGFLTDYAMDDVPPVKSGIYKIDMNGNLQKIKETKNVSGLNFIPDGKNIAYLTDNNEENYRLPKDEQKYNLHIIDSAGTNDTVIIENISSYVWSPN